MLKAGFLCMRYHTQVLVCISASEKIYYRVGLILHAELQSSLHGSTSWHASGEITLAPHANQVWLRPAFHVHDSAHFSVLRKVAQVHLLSFVSTPRFCLRVILPRGGGHDAHAHSLDLHTDMASTNKEVLLLLLHHCHEIWERSSGQFGLINTSVKTCTSK